MGHKSVSRLIAVHFMLSYLYCCQNISPISTCHVTLFRLWWLLKQCNHLQHINLAGNKRLTGQVEDFPLLLSLLLLLLIAVAISAVAVVVFAIGEHCLFHFQCFFMLSQTCRSLTLQGCSRVRLII